MMIRKAAKLADGLSPAESKLYEQFRAERIKLGKSDPGAFPTQTAAFLVAWDSLKLFERKVLPYLNVEFRDHLLY